jgi:hypothetical protein
LKNGNWNDAQLRAAMAIADKGCLVQTTALDYDISRSTLRSHVMGLTMSQMKDRKLVIKLVEEEKIVNYILDMENYGHPINITMLKTKVAEATQLQVTPFKQGICMQGWLHWFRKHHL